MSRCCAPSSRPPADLRDVHERDADAPVRRRVSRAALHADARGRRRRLRLPATRDEHAAPGGRGPAPRCGERCTVARIVGVHLKALPGSTDQRLQQAEILAQRLVTTEKLGDQLPTIVLGDFNSHRMDVNGHAADDWSLIDAVFKKHPELALELARLSVRQHVPRQDRPRLPPRSSVDWSRDGVRRDGRRPVQPRLGDGAGRIERHYDEFRITAR